MKFTEANEKSYDITVYDGGVRYFYSYPDGVTEVTPQQVADFFLVGYDGAGEIRFEIIFSVDEHEWGADEVFYAKGEPDGEAKLCDPVGYERDQWTS